MKKCFVTSLLFALPIMTIIAASPVLAGQVTSFKPAEPGVFEVCPDTPQKIADMRVIAGEAVLIKKDPPEGCFFVIPLPGKELSRYKKKSLASRTKTHVSANLSEEECLKVSRDWEDCRSC
jgi:hypothetical protein